MTDEQNPGRLEGFPGVSGTDDGNSCARFSVALRHDVGSQLRQLATSELREQAYLLERVTPPMFAGCGLRLRCIVHELMLRFLAGAQR